MTPAVIAAVLAWLILSPFLGSAIGRRLKRNHTETTRRGNR